MAVKLGLKAGGSSRGSKKPVVLMRPPQKRPKDTPLTSQDNSGPKFGNLQSQK